ncbi:dynein intermediate chain 3, ciliary-like [Onthophagus taurus]|uniref:dynein intermediate chain 3, ciliary-like n=1 Tax=Onthophagus taurus TaxID=166361 RepID=UPI000C20ACE1|nr:dynein intermediate chain 3, ciliary-like [Onthophagus taurus]XP_022901460.1 dynein intermediate chain 3, ciliary-like [Onthophagus taurus]
METTYIYQKKRSEFGRQCLFSDKGPDLIDNYPSNRRYLHEYILQDPVERGTQLSTQYAVHELNTDRATYVNSGMCHVEGGWPKDVNVNDEEQTKRYRRKIEKDETYTVTLIQLCKNMENCILQNNAINIYQQYYTDVEPTPLVEKNSARTVNVYQDQYNITRPITNISWSSDSGTKMATCYCNLKYQADISQESKNALIWEVENPNVPLLTLKPSANAICLEYNPKDVNTLISGHINGQVGVWDLRKGCEPIDMTVMEVGFRDPVHSALWIASKSGYEFYTGSTDGQVKWWDLRKLNEPLETLILDLSNLHHQVISHAYSAIRLEYEMTMPTRFMVGTEEGFIVAGNRKGKTPQEKLTGKYQAHLGPVMGLERNPMYAKNFLSVGDWTARIWSEECRESCIMWTNYHKAMLTDCAWSPTRFSVYFTTRSDGVLDVWDILQQQKHACIGVKICDDALTKIRTHEAGRLVAVGSQKGTIYLVEFSENLSFSTKNDKALLTAMFERETKREKILEGRNRELRLKLKAKAEKGDEIEKEPSWSPLIFVDHHVMEAEADFLNTIDSILHPVVEEEKKAEET